MTDEEKWNQRVLERLEMFMTAYRDFLADVDAYEAKGFTSSQPVTDTIWSAKAVRNFINNQTADTGDHIGHFNAGRFIP